jgi:hypothetical protein
MQPRLFPYSPERDVYRLLQVAPSAESYEIMAAIRRLARTFHPDRNGSPRATEEMQVVNAVRNLLIDPQARARYDHARHRFLAENAARRRRGAVLEARSGARLPAPIVRTRPIASRIALTGRALMAALRAILDAFAPARGRLLTTKAGAARGAATAAKPAPTVKPAPVAKPAPAVKPAPVVEPEPQPVVWEANCEIVLDPEPLAAEVAVPPLPSASPPVSWDPDAEIVLEPVPMAIPPTTPVWPMTPLPISRIKEAIPIGEQREPVAARRGTVVPYRSSAVAVRGSFWEASAARVVAGGKSEIGVQDCERCGLALSASARFCRRCGSSQARSA